MSHKITIENNAEAKMRDGTTLRADIYHPADDNKYPVLLCRTPYQKLTPRYVDIATTLAVRGYTAVVQDQRGRYASDGEYRWMFRHRDETFDIEDGYDTCEWAAALPWNHIYAAWNWPVLDHVLSMTRGHRYFVTPTAGGHVDLSRLLLVSRRWVATSEMSGQKALPSRVMSRPGSSFPRRGCCFHNKPI